VAWAQGPWDPSEAEVPWTGAPAPVEGRTSGGALSPHGSHVGLKAVLDAGEEPVAGALAAIAIHDGRASRLARLAVASVVLLDGEGAPLAPTDPAVVFEPWGWAVTSRSGDVAARVRVSFVAEDAILLSVRLDNEASFPRTLSVVLDVDDGQAAPDGADVLVTVGDATLAAGGAGSLAIDDEGPPARLVLGAPELEGGASATTTVMLGFGAEADEARRARDRGFVAFASRDADLAWQEQADSFEAVRAAAACSELEGREAEQIQRLAVSALWNARYAPRAALTRTLLSAAKSRDNAFLGSDLPAQAIALTAWDPEAGLGALLGQIDALADDSHVPYRFDDELVRDPLPNGSMPPVQAQALVAAARWGAVLSADERGRVARRLDAVSAWWPTNRDFRRAGLLVHGSPEEAGRPGSRRWPIVDGTSEAAYFEAPDLASTYVEFLLALADLEEDVPDGDPETLRAHAEDVRRQLHDDLWDGERGVWLDLDTRTTERATVVGPFTIAPLAAGLARDEDAVQRALDETLLEPDVLWGDEDGPRLPVPELAYDTPDLDAAERPSWVEDVALALRALSRYGRADEAGRLEERVLALVASRPEGLYDRYYAGELPADGPPALQPGRAAAELLGILHRDHERERFVLSGETRIEGRIGEARFLDDLGRLVHLGERARIPRLVLESADPEEPLEDRGAWRLTLDESCDVAAGESVDVELPALGPFHWIAEDGSASGRATGSFPAVVGKTYRLEPLRLRGGGCACEVGARGAEAGHCALALLGAALVLAGTRRPARSLRRRGRERVVLLERHVGGGGAAAALAVAGRVDAALLQGHAGDVRRVRAAGQGGLPTSARGAEGEQGDEGEGAGGHSGAPVGEGAGCSCSAKPHGTAIDLMSRRVDTWPGRAMSMVVVGTPATNTTGTSTGSSPASTPSTSTCAEPTAGTEISTSP